MVNEKTGQRELCYVIKVGAVSPIVGKDRVECAMVNGWTCMVPKGVFHEGDLGIYFEIDSLVDYTKPEFAFTSKYNGKIKIQKFKAGDGSFYSQGLLMSPVDFGWTVEDMMDGSKAICDEGYVYHEGYFLTEKLGVTYIDTEDRARKSMKSVDKYAKMPQWYPNVFKNPIIKKLYKTKFGKKVLYIFFGHKKKVDTAFPDGKFPGVARTDQERIENIPIRLQDKEPYIVTQKCDGSSATYILARKPHYKHKYEFYVCSRNVRMLKPSQKCYYGEHNYYWEGAEKYDIENKMREWLEQNPDATFVCWQGELCSPNIQSNPHCLTETHLYCFHWTDSVHGRMDLRAAIPLWKSMEMETVPLVSDNYYLPKDMETFKTLADGYYDPSVCEGKTTCKREGFVYYSTIDPRKSFKNVSRAYLLSKK